MTHIENLLNGPGMFFCKRYNVKMMIKSCIMRQEKAKKLAEGGRQSDAITALDRDCSSIINCLNCKQGQQNKEVKSVEEKKHRGRPPKIKATIDDQDKAHITPCVDNRSAKDAIEAAQIVGVKEASGQEKEKTCIHCGNTAIGTDEIEIKFPRNDTCKDGFGNVCKKCKYTRKQERAKEREKEMKKPESALIVTVDFNKWPDVYKRLTEEAKNNFRSVPMHLIALAGQIKEAT